jgi:hypothetical protein
MVSRVLASHVHREDTVILRKLRSDSFEEDDYGDNRINPDSCLINIRQNKDGGKLSDEIVIEFRELDSKELTSIITICPESWLDAVEVPDGIGVSTSGDHRIYFKDVRLGLAIYKIHDWMCQPESWEERITTAYAHKQVKSLILSPTKEGKEVFIWPPEYTLQPSQNSIPSL